MIFLRFLIILASAILMFSTTESFAASGSTISIPTNLVNKSMIIFQDIDRIYPWGFMDFFLKWTGSSSNEDVREDIKEDDNTESSAYKVLLDSAISQGKKDLKKIIQRFNKVTSDPDQLIFAYEGIRGQFERKRREILKKDTSDPVKNEFWLPYYDYMISSLNSTIKNLE